MDDGFTYRNVSLDKALLPDPSSPLLPTQFIPNAGTNVFNIVGGDTVSVTKGASSTLGQTIVGHNLGFIPKIMAWLVTPDGNGDPAILDPLPRVDTNLTNGAVDIIYKCQAQKTELDFFIIVPTTGLSYASVVTAKMQYTLLREAAKT